MTFEVVFTSGARRDLNELPIKIALAVVAFCEGPLATDPDKVGKPLQRDLAGLHSARRGAYRIIYRIDRRVVTVDVIRIRHRADSYHAN